MADSRHLTPDDFIPVEPADAGFDPELPGILHRAVDLQISQGLAKGMQLLVARGEKLVVDEAFGSYTQDSRPITPETRFILGSASKPLSATPIHILADRGSLTYNDPVSLHIPEFAANGKDAITISHLLTHTAGIPDPVWEQVPAVTYLDAEAAVAAISAMKLEYTPGTQAIYHGATSWALLGEIVRRVSGVSLDEFCRKELFGPLHMARTTWGLPDELEEETTDYIGMDEETDAEIVFWRSKAARHVVLGAANAHSTARDVGRFYLMWLQEGILGNHRIMGPAVARNAVRVHVPWAPNLSHGFGYGFWVGCDRSGVWSRGNLGSSRMFGHPGHWCSVAWADPGNRVIFVALSNVGPGQEASDRRFAILSDLVQRSVLN